MPRVMTKHKSPVHHLHPRPPAMMKLSAIALVLSMILVLMVQNAVSFSTMARLQRASRLAMSDSEGEAPVAATPDAPATKGFGKVKEIAPIEKDAGTRTYEKQAKRGVPEYNVFLRPTNGTEMEWVPVGSMTIPRDTKVGTAVFEVEGELLKGTFKLYPKLKAFYELRSDKATAFEYGYCLKAFPDELITPIVRENAQEKTMMSVFTNWLGKITDPMDTSDLKNPGEMTMKQD